VLYYAVIEQAMAWRYFDELAAAGRHHFTMADAMAALGGSAPAVRATLRRAAKRGEIASPHRGFYVVVPPEYRRLRCLPPEQFIPQLMKHLGEVYYVALRSAAELHGAAHQRPQAFQVMVRKNRRPIECGAARVQFVARHDLDRTPVLWRNTPRGAMRVSSPEATALELVGYADQCGGLDNVASVLDELAESLRPQELLAAARLCPAAWSQRLGYLLEKTGRDELADVLEGHVRDEAPTLAPLVRALPMKGTPRSRRWKLALNASVDGEP
jgi:predicted transcriptional regulator of viral defense system